MLKLEKTADLSTIVIRIREKERFFEPGLVKALAIALILHSGALILIHVTPFSFTSNFIFPLVRVQSDLPLAATSALVVEDINEEEFAPPPFLFAPPLEWVSGPSEFPLPSSVMFDPSMLDSIEKNMWPKWNEPLLYQLEEPLVQLSISGDLAKIPLISDDPLLNQIEPLTTHSPFYVVYEVQLDQATGEIFWFERTENSGIKRIDQLTETILLNLRFAPLNQEDTIKGTLSFIVLNTSNE